MGGQHGAVRRPKIRARLRDDPEYRAELEAARAWSTPPGLFRGGPWPGPGEPLWTEADRDEAIALLLEEWDTCRGCGQRLSQATEPDAEGMYTVDEVMCAGCQVREAVSEKDSYRGRLLRVRRKD
jgi:hypothetical protein